MKKGRERRSDSRDDDDDGDGGGGARKAASGKRSQVDEEGEGDGATASAAGGRSVAWYKRETKILVKEIFDQKERAIDNMGESLDEKEPAGSGFLATALEYLIPLGAGRFARDLHLDELAASVFQDGMSAFAGAVAKGMRGQGAEQDPKEFCANYAALLQKHDRLVGDKMAARIDSKAEGQKIHAGVLKQSQQLSRIYQDAQREALDAWTQAQQKKGTKENGKNQGYSDASTGQLHLDKLTLFIESGRTLATDARQARMEKVSDKAAELNSRRALGSIPVQRTVHLKWSGWGVHGEIGVGVSASGAIASDEIGSIDKFALASYYHGKRLDRDDSPIAEGKHDQKIIDRDWTKGRDKLWNSIAGKTTAQLGFSIKGD